MEQNSGPQILAIRNHRIGLEWFKEVKIISHYELPGQDTDNTDFGRDIPVFEWLTIEDYQFRYC